MAQSATPSSPRRPPAAIVFSSDQDHDGVRYVVNGDSIWNGAERNVPSLFFSSNLHADYHTPRDEPKAIDCAKLTRMI